MLNQNDKYKLDKGPYKLYKVGLLYRQVEFKKIGLDVKPIIHQSELRTYKKIVPFALLYCEKYWMEWNK